MKSVHCIRYFNHPAITIVLLTYFCLTIQIVLKHFEQLNVLSFSLTKCFQANSTNFLAVNTTKNITKSTRNLNDLHWILLILSNSDQKIYSQNGEDGILTEIFDHIGHGGKEYVEFGVQTGIECNTRNLRVNHGWHGHLFDNENANYSINLTRADIWVDNIVQLFANFSISKKLDLLSIDTDFGDFWLTKTLFDAGYRPRVFVVEFNRNFNVHESVTVPEKLASHHGVWDGSNYFGASVLALTKLMHSYGYLLVKINKNAVNLFFIHFNELNGVDFPLMNWVGSLSLGTHVGIQLHPKDWLRRAYVHVCAGPICDSSDDW